MAVSALEISASNWSAFFLTQPREVAGIKRDLLRNLFGREQKIGKRAGGIA